MQTAPVHTLVPRISGYTLWACDEHFDKVLIDATLPASSPVLVEALLDAVIALSRVDTLKASLYRVWDDGREEYYEFDSSTWQPARTNEDQT